MLRGSHDRWMLTAACAAWLLVAGAATALAQESESDSPASRPGWSKGPHTGSLGGQAQIDVPEGAYFLDAAATRAALSRFDVILELERATGLEPATSSLGNLCSTN